MKKKKQDQTKKLFSFRFLLDLGKKNFSSDSSMVYYGVNARAHSHAYGRASVHCLPVSSFIFVDAVAAAAIAAASVCILLFLSLFRFMTFFAEFWDSIRSYTDQKRQRQQHQHTETHTEPATTIFFSFQIKRPSI